jgi:uncharacterized protein (DUF58 family)
LEVNLLFPPRLLAAVETLSLDARPAPATPDAGAHLSRAAGASMDFHDYRPYTAGDDLRRVDWNVYRRSGHLFVRRYQHPASVPVHIAVDTSQSMFVETPARYTAAARMALAVASGALRNHDPLTLLASPDAPPLALTGRRRLHEIAARLAGQSPSPAASLPSVLSSLRSLRPGIACIVSDFFDDRGAEALADELSSLPHRLVLVQVTQPWDADPALADDAELIDCESHRVVAVAPTPLVLRAYRDAYTAYNETLAAFATRRGARFVRVDASADPIAELAKLFPNGILSVGGVTR